MLAFRVNQRNKKYKMLGKAIKYYKKKKGKKGCKKVPNATNNIKKIKENLKEKKSSHTNNNLLFLGNTIPN